MGCIFLDLTGIWRCNDGGTYYLRQEGDDLWWAGEDPEQKWTHLFKGTVTEETIEGEWIGLPKGKSTEFGRLTLNIFQGNKLTGDSPGGNLSNAEWKKENVMSAFSNFIANQNEFLSGGFSEENSLTGGWVGDDNGFYYLREMGDTVWWFGEHPKRLWANLFKGVRSGDTIKGEWIDIPKGKTSGKGSLELKVDSNGILKLIEESSGFSGSLWLKLIGDYLPGEAGYDSNFHPETWAIKWDDRPGLNFDAYDTVLRTPYIQNVTGISATVLWRISLPSGINPADIITALKAEVLVAPIDVPVANGTQYTPQNGIEISDVSWTYLYRESAIFDQDPPSRADKEIYRLNTLRSRPIIQFKAEFEGLQPGTVYHYRIKSNSIDPIGGLNESKMEYLTLVYDTYFKTAATADQSLPLRFLAMGNLGPGDGKSSYFYDVFDLFHDVARKYSPQLWLALGGLDNNTGGHPNAVDPYFFSLYNAYHDHNFEKSPRPTSNLSYRAKETGVKAFRKPPYYGLLGGLPVYPTFGGRDLGLKKTPSLESWRKAYLGNFQLPADGIFNRAGRGFFYTFRYGKVIFISLGIPGNSQELGPGRGNWKAEWGNRQQSYLQAYLRSLKNEISAPDVWVVVYFHDHHWGYTLDSEETKQFSKFLAESGVDLVFMGLLPSFAHKTVKHDHFDYRAVVVGTGGNSGTSWHGTRTCKRPGFIMANVYQDTFEYWKFDTHKCKRLGEPEDREALKPAVHEFCTIKKLGFGKHEVKEMDLNSGYFF
jgi:hypothetical protein